MVDGLDVGSKLGLEVKLLEFEFVAHFDAFDLSRFIRATESIEHSLNV